eukprot:137896-Chlamydomonas_euryale.AAC.4
MAGWLAGGCEAAQDKAGWLLLCVCACNAACSCQCFATLNTGIPKLARHLEPWLGLRLCSGAYSNGIQTRPH